MKSLKLLIFEISGEYGHFRKFNTTSSPLTYAIPTRTAIAGILGAILGIEREIGPNVFREGVVPVNELFNEADSQIGIQILAPIKKVNIGFNLLDTGKSASSFFNITNRTQIEFELLKNPSFRIFFTHTSEKIFDELSERVREIRHHFTPYLGLSQFTSLVKWVGEEVSILEIAKVEYTPIRTVVNLSKLGSENPIQFGNASYTTETMPLFMQRDRIVTNYSEVLLERLGKPIMAKTENYWKTSFGNILFL
ncbi:MAG: CRISPR-associated protein Cas5h [Saprospiraceae bacterium]|jgi:CRISPR-associated protein Cas5h